MANILVTIATNVGQYLAEPAIREVKYFLCVNNVINDLENEKEALTSERDNVLTRVAEAEQRTEVIEKPVEKWLNDVENLLREVEVLEERMDRENNCFYGLFPTYGRYLLCKQMVEKIVAMQKLKGKSNDIQPFSHRAPLPGIRYQSSEDFVYFGSRQKAYDELFETLNDDSIHMIGLYGDSGSGKTFLVIEVGNKIDILNMFDQVISITVSRTSNIRDIQGEIAEMLNLPLSRDSERGRAQCIWECLKKKKRVLVIVDGLWREFNLMDIGIFLDKSNKGRWKILVTTCNELVCTSMECQKKIHLGLLSEDESWTLFQKHASIDDEYSKLLDDVPRKICNECKRLPITIKTAASLLKGRHGIEWQQEYDKLKDSKASGDEGGLRPTLSQEAQQLLLLCSLFPEDYYNPTEDLMRYAIGLRVGERLSLLSMRSLIQTDINKLLESGFLMHDIVTMPHVVLVATIWIAHRSKNSKILVNVDKPLKSVAEDNKIRDCFALSSWWYSKYPSFCQLHAPNLKMLLLNINAQTSWKSLDLSHLTFEGIQGLEVFSLTINHKLVALSFPPSIQLLTNVRTLRLNGLKLGDISFIGSLARVEILDLQHCDFNELPIQIGKLRSLKLLDLSECRFLEKTYNRAIGKCSQLEELYASKCSPDEYVHEIILDIGILPNLQRFVFGDPITRERARVVQVNDFNISKLRTSNKNILQIAETISLKGLHGGCKSIVPDMVGVVGGMNDLASLHLLDCQEIECILDFKEDALIMRLVELRLSFMNNLTDLYRGPPLQVLRYFEKLELLDIQICMQLHVIFPRECKLQNLKILRLSDCKTNEVLFSASVAQSLQQLEELRICGCNELKHIISASGSEHGGCNTSEEIIPTPLNSHFLMNNLRDVDVSYCQSLESIFPICYVKGLTLLNRLFISYSPNLKFVFGECDYKSLSLHQYKNQVMLPHLEHLNLISLDNLIGMCLENCQAQWPTQSMSVISIQGCPKLAKPWFSLKVGHDQKRYRPIENPPSNLILLKLIDFPELHSISWVGPAQQIWNFQCLKHLTVGNCENLQCLLSMETHRSLPELMSFEVYNCQKLEQLVEADEELVEIPNAELYFPKLEHIKVYNCNKLKSLFPFAMVTMLPQLSTLEITKSTLLKEVFSHGPGEDIIDEIQVPLPNLIKIAFDDLPNFVDICLGCNLYVFKLRQLNISNCPKTAPTLRKIQDVIERSSNRRR